MILLSCPDSNGEISFSPFRGNQKFRNSVVDRAIAWNQPTQDRRKDGQIGRRSTTASNGEGLADRLLVEDCPSFTPAKFFASTLCDDDAALARQH
jgi:hypothetical protein